MKKVYLLYKYNRSLDLEYVYGVFKTKELARKAMKYWMEEY